VATLCAAELGTKYRNIFPYHTPRTHREAVVEASDDPSCDSASCSIGKVAADADDNVCHILDQLLICCFERQDYAKEGVTRVRPEVIPNQTALLIGAQGPIK
jgi:hypothetical protein